MSNTKPQTRRPIRRVTLVHCFIKKAKEIMPEHTDLQDFSDFQGDVNSPNHIDEFIFHKCEYLGGMAAVLIKLIK